MGFTSPVSGNHSFRVLNKKWMWITPSGIPRYNLHEEDLVKVHLETRKTLGRLKPSIEWHMHVSIYIAIKIGKIAIDHLIQEFDAERLCRYLFRLRVC